ncbi:MAG: tRNA pseudouridine(38-40) synthase TruA [Lachnospiraceae bacterium]|nr:tRNA pseudouridine(38-40) synthase TruA [Lachnospiraceae bacterium]
MKRNVKLTIRYDGTRYYGWEHQPGEPMTIQGKLEQVSARMLSLPEGEIPQIIGAGRTDAGVHARAMIACFHADTDMTEEEIKRYFNRYLPDDIGIDRVQFASPRFHARYNATGKLYCYSLWTGESKPVFERRYLTVLGAAPDVEKMRDAAAHFIGTHDFKSFCANPRMKKSTVRTVDEIRLKQEGDILRIYYHGNGFLQNMVRILTGTLLEVGFSRMESKDIPGIMAALDRKKAGPTAPPEGLCLIRVDY